MCIYESLLFHPKIFSVSTYSKQGDINRALQHGREKREAGGNYLTGHLRKRKELVKLYVFV